MDELKAFIRALIVEATGGGHQGDLGYRVERREKLQNEADELFAAVEALIPVEDVCAMCNKPIEYVGPYWRHTGGYSPRHPATPKKANKDSGMPVTETVLLDLLERMQQRPGHHGAVPGLIEFLIALGIPEEKLAKFRR